MTGWLLICTLLPLPSQYPYFGEPFVVGPFKTESACKAHHVPVPEGFYGVQLFCLDLEKVRKP